jgi:hypothetical protein
MAFLTNSLIKDYIEQEALIRTTVKKKCCKWAKNYGNKNGRRMLQKSISSSNELD